MAILGPNGKPASNGIATYADAVPSSSTMTSVTADSYQGFRRVLGMLPEIDDLEDQEGPDIYDRMLDDAHVWANVFQLKSRILSKDWDVEPAGDSPEAETVYTYVEETLRTVDMGALTEHLVEAAVQKWAVVELVWDRPEGPWRPDYFKEHDVEYFRLTGKTGRKQLVYTGHVEINEPVPPYKFIFHINMPSPKRPYGRSLLQSAYWPWRFKQIGWEAWATVLDRYGVPSLVALANTSNKDDLEAISGDLQAIANGSSAALGNIDSVDTVGDFRAEGFEAFHDFCNAEISKAILTSTLTTQEGRSDRERGDTSVHDEQAEAVARYISGRLEDRIGETLIQWIVFMRFGEEALPLTPVFRYDWRERASWDEIEAAMEQGVPLSRRTLENDYNLPLAQDGGEDAFVSPAFDQQGAGLLMADDDKKKALTGRELERMILPTPRRFDAKSATGTKSKTD